MGEIVIGLTVVGDRGGVEIGCSSTFISSSSSEKRCATLDVCDGGLECVSPVKESRDLAFGFLSVTLSQGDGGAHVGLLDKPCGVECD